MRATSFSFYKKKKLLLPYCIIGVSGAAQIIGDLVTGRTAESISHYQSVVFDDSEGIGKVIATSFVIDCGIVLLCRCNLLLKC